MKVFLTLAQIATSVILITLILLQAKGTGLGGAFGSESGVYRSKRGVEKIIFRLTIVFSILLILISFAAVLIK